MMREMLKNKGMRVTPQRVAVYGAILSLGNHPTAEQICHFIRENNPGIATGTVYKVLEALVVNGLVCKVKTDRDVMRYDALTGPHHHLYCEESERIEDFFDEELNALLDGYLRRKGIPGFSISDIRLQINGKFISKP